MIPPQLTPVLERFAADCQPWEVQAVTSGGFSGARLWRLTTRRGLLCLRQWPRELNSAERLQWIQAVLWHASRAGFDLLPIPVETRDQQGFVEHDSHFWELAQWLPGTADYHLAPSRTKLAAALEMLARFHRSVEAFPLIETSPAAPPGLLKRVQRIGELLAGGFDQLEQSMLTGDWPELFAQGKLVLQLARQAAVRVRDQVIWRPRRVVPLQVCLRDIWHEHVLFEQSRVSGLIDFGAMAVDCVATDIARLLGSLAIDDPASWRWGLAAYRSIRQLSDAEATLIEDYDLTSVLLSGVQWLDWVYLQQRVFANRGGVMTRLDFHLRRLRKLIESPAKLEK